MTNKTFKVAGITTHGDSTKVRFTSDLIRRVKQFSAGGASRVDLVELPSEMTKVEAIKYLMSHEAFQSAGDQATLQDSLEDRTPKAPRVAKETKVKVKKEKATPSLDSIKARAKSKKATAEVSPTE
jgi:hypothetical protein